MAVFIDIVGNSKHEVAYEAIRVAQGISKEGSVLLFLSGTLSYREWNNEYQKTKREFETTSYHTFCQDDEAVADELKHVEGISIIVVDGLVGSLEGLDNLYKFAVRINKPVIVTRVVQQADLVVSEGQ